MLENARVTVPRNASSSHRKWMQLPTGPMSQAFGLSLLFVFDIQFPDARFYIIPLTT